MSPTRNNSIFVSRNLKNIFTGLKLQIEHDFHVKGHNINVGRVMVLNLCTFTDYILYLYQTV